MKLWTKSELRTAPGKKAGTKKKSEVYRRRKLDIRQTTKSDAIDSECERVTGVVATH